MQIQENRCREMGGHGILAVERFQDDTRHMIEFAIRKAHTQYGPQGAEMRLFLDETGHQNALASERRGEIKIKRHAHVIEGHIVQAPKKKRRKP